VSDLRDPVAAAVPAGESGRPRPTIHIEGAVKSFDGRVVVDVGELTLGEHPIEGLIGPNGAGKTTLLRMIMHSISLDRGTITLFAPDDDGGEVLSQRRSPAIAGLGVVKTNQVIQDFERLTILDSMLLSIAKASDERAYQIYRENGLYDEHAEEIRGYLDYFEIDDADGFALSAGEKKLLDIIRCLLLHPKVLLLDEPTAGLPTELRDRVMDLFKEKATTENVSVVIVEHDLNVIWALSDHVHFMAEGRVILQGDPASIRQHETVIEKYLGSGHVGR
jgi:ABC-type branched-subunit amino acid transport system ATPase component